MRSHFTLVGAALALSAAPAVAQVMTYVPTTVVSGPTQGDTGVLGPGFFAEHTVRATDAVVLEAPVTIGRRTIPAGTVLARAATDFGPMTPTYCNVRPRGRWSRGDVDCLRDTDGDARLDTSLQGVTSPGDFTFGVAAMGGGRPLPAPVAYREATVEERPTTRFAMVLCRSIIGSGGFAVSVPISGSDWLQNQAPCPITPQTGEEGRVITFQSLRIAVSEPRDGGVWTVLAPLSPGDEVRLSFSRRR